MIYPQDVSRPIPKCYKDLERLRIMSKSKIYKATTIELLALRYFMEYGQSPKLAFWSWLESLQIEPKEEKLKELLEEEWEKDEPK